MVLNIKINTIITKDVRGGVEYYSRLKVTWDSNKYFDVFEKNGLSQILVSFLSQLSWAAKENASTDFPVLLIATWTVATALAFTTMTLQVQTPRTRPLLCLQTTPLALALWRENVPKPGEKLSTKPRERGGHPHEVGPPLAWDLYWWVACSAVVN